MAAVRGLGDVEFDQATEVLESAGWDVAEALGRLSAASEAAEAAALASAAARRRRARRAEAAAARGALRAARSATAPGQGPEHTGQELDLEEMEQMRMQQELGRAMGHEDVAHWHHHHRSVGEQGGGMLHRGAGGQVFAPHSRISMMSAMQAAARATGAMRRHDVDLAQIFEMNGFLAEDLSDEEDDAEAVNLQALFEVLVRSQDEQDLQDALRRSTEEAYTGGFSKPPVDEAVLQKVTTVTQYKRGDEAGQCAVCLADYEPGDALRHLECTHSFHMVCVDQWLAQSGQCPVCKARVGGGSGC